MALLFPFRALRPTPSSAPHVAAVPYDVVSVEEARALVASQSLSFLRISRPEVDLPAATDPHADEAYATAVANLATLRERAPLVDEDLPSIYLYRLQMGDHVQTGVAACFAVDEYEQNLIRKHERTRRDKEDDRTRHIVELRAQTGPVFLLYRARPELRVVLERVTSGAPLFDFTADDGIRHVVWRASAADAAMLTDGFSHVPALYIADGHHRAAAAARARAALAGTSSESSRFLAVAFADDEAQVLPYNRLVADLGPHSTEAFLQALQQRFKVTKGPATPSRRGDVAMFLDGQWHTVTLGVPPANLAPADRLDVSLLQTQVLQPLLGIDDPTTSRRIEFVGGARGTAALEEAVRSGRAAVAFSMHPVSVDDIMKISDAGGIMPPKSTWFEPKLRDGLLSHPI
jgi:uncharacterized protein (DUF1015 family)